MQPDAKRQKQASVSVVTRRLSELSEAERQCWRSLEARALEPNIYLGCDFIDSLSRFILTEVDITLLIVERLSQEVRQYIAVLPLVRSRMARWLPFPWEPRGGEGCGWYHPIRFWAD